MTEQELENYEIDHILSDYSSIYKIGIDCINNGLDSFVFIGMLPYANLLVAEGYEYLTNHEIILADDKYNEKIKKIKKLRAKAIKLYDGFKFSTYKSLNQFNEEEYLKFFHKKYPTEENPYMTLDVKNYQMALLNGDIIGNYHLASKKVFGFEIGSYLEDITANVSNLAFEIYNFISKISNIFDSSIKDYETTRKLHFDIKFSEMNMAYDYKNFRIKRNPPILMAMLDVLSVLNYYNKIFSEINDNFNLDLKIKYISIFYGIVSTKNILAYCDDIGYEIEFGEELKEFIKNNDNKINNNKLRKICMHYDFASYSEYENPLEASFENFFKISIEQVSKMLSEKLIELAYLIDRAVFNYHIKS